MEIRVLDRLLWWKRPNRLEARILEMLASHLPEQSGSVLLQQIAAIRSCSRDAQTTSFRVDHDANLAEFAEQGSIRIATIVDGGSKTACHVRVLLGRLSALELLGGNLDLTSAEVIVWCDPALPRGVASDEQCRQVQELMGDAVTAAAPPLDAARRERLLGILGITHPPTDYAELLRHCDGYSSPAYDVSGVLTAEIVTLEDGEMLVVARPADGRWLLGLEPCGERGGFQLATPDAPDRIEVGSSLRSALDHVRQLPRSASTEP